MQSYFLPYNIFYNSYMEAKMAKNTNIQEVPGCIYLNKTRYWWRVKLPGQDKYATIPLKPVGAKLAATDLSVAKEVARNLWEQAIYAAHNTVTGDPNDWIHEYIDTQNFFDSGWEPMKPVCPECHYLK